MDQGITNWSKKLWDWVKALIKAVVAVGVVALLWQEYKDHRQETERYNSLLRSTYSEAILNRASAQDASGHFASGQATVSDVTAEVAQSLALDKQAPDSLKLRLNVYVRQMRGASKRIAYASDIYKETCSLSEFARDDIVTKLEKLVASDIDPMIDALQEELSERELDRPILEGVREGSLRRYCVPPT